MSFAWVKSMVVSEIQSLNCDSAYDKKDTFSAFCAGACAYAVVTMATQEVWFVEIHFAIGWQVIIDIYITD